MTVLSAQPRGSTHGYSSSGRSRHPPYIELIRSRTSSSFPAAIGPRRASGGSRPGGTLREVFAASRTGTKSQMSGGLGRDRWSRLELKDLLTNRREDVRARLKVRYVASPEASLPLKRQSACLSNLHRLVSVTTAPARLSITSAAAAS